MPDQLNTLYRLVGELQDLDMVQEWIDQARRAAPTNEIVQSALNLRQTHVTHKRAQIELVMLGIASQN